MSKVECEANTKAKISGNAEDLARIVRKVASLKLDQNISYIKFLLTDGDRCDNYMKKGIANLVADLLQSNPNIKTLRLYSTNSNDRQAREYLLQIMADGIAGDSIEYLWLDNHRRGEISADETASDSLTRLRFDVTGASGLHLVSCLPTSLKTSVRNLCLDVWQCRGMVELGAMLGHCSSLLSLNLIAYDGEHVAEAESFFRSIGQLRSLTHLEVDLRFAVSADVINAVRYFVVQQGTLAHFAIDARHGHYVSYVESWKGLGLALCSVKGVSLRIRSRNSLLAVLPQLLSCESLVFDPCGAEIHPIFEVASRLPNLRNIAVIGAIHHSLHVAVHDAILDMIKSNNSIATVKCTMPAAFQGSIESFCVLNRVFGTNLIGFGPTDLWTRVLSKMSDESARATLLYRLLREKPEMIIGSIMQSDSMQ